ncbi:hypothetical protein EBR96_04365 [bacterium]|nr:hypothetical protein [bacterium]
MQVFLQWVGALGILASILIVVVAYFYNKSKAARAVVEVAKDPAAAIFDQLAELLKNQLPASPMPVAPPKVELPPVVAPVQPAPKPEPKPEVKVPQEDWRILSHRLIAKLLEIFKANNNTSGAKLLVQVGRTLYDDSVVTAPPKTNDELSQQG